MGFNLKEGVLEKVAIPHYESLGFEVRKAEKDSFHDLEVRINKEMRRICVRSTSSKQHSGKYALNITHDRKGGQFKFNRESCDAVFAYIIPEERIEVINVKNIKKSAVENIYID